MPSSAARIEVPSGTERLTPSFCWPLVIGPKPEITRFKGLGEISPDEFKHFIGKDIRLEPVLLDQQASVQQLLNYYMGKNTQERQEFMIDNLRVELDVVEELVK